MLLIFSDLDATLLDHESYSFEKAIPALDRLKKNQFPLILTSSKTRAEMIHIQKQLGIKDPFIFENGSGIFFNTVQNRGVTHKEIINTLFTLKQHFNFQLFSEFSLEDLEKLVGLDQKACERAQNRQFSEPIIWNDKEDLKPKFQDLLSQKNLIAQQGGRFLTISGNQTKADALLWVKNKYQSSQNSKIFTIGLGDSENDISMLERCDYAILIKHPTKPSPKINHSNLIETKQVGPAGWNDAINELLDQYE
jgi:mannosyl-3-phosphoglycerate phosphatase